MDELFVDAGDQCPQHDPDVGHIFGEIFLETANGFVGDLALGGRSGCVLAVPFVRLFGIPCQVE